MDKNASPRNCPCRWTKVVVNLRQDPPGSGQHALTRPQMGYYAHPPARSMSRACRSYSSHKSMRALRDRMAIVFQQFNLFQNMDVRTSPIADRIKEAPRARWKPRPRAFVKGGARREASRLSALGRATATRRHCSCGTETRILLLEQGHLSARPGARQRGIDTSRGLARIGMTMLIVSTRWLSCRVSARV